MKRIKKLCRKFLSGQAGISLVAMAIFILVLGFLFTAGAQIYDIWKRYEAPAVSSEKLAFVQDAINSYVRRHGRWPCPASLTADINTADFGVESGADIGDPEGHRDCLTVLPDPGTGIRVATSTVNETVDGTTYDKTGWQVITGAVPVRTLGIGDEYIFDGFDRRFVYAVTRNYTNPDQEAAPKGDAEAAISVLDSAGNSATEIPGAVVHLVYSMGFDSNGAYGVRGNLIAPCDTSTLAGENCDFDADTEFLNTVITSDNERNAAAFFVHQVAYNPPQAATCEEADPKRYKDVTFLLDTSGSMSQKLNNRNCPSSVASGGCSRMEVAHWAVRRAITSRIYDNYNNPDPNTRGTTNFTGFLGRDTVGGVTQRIKDRGGLLLDDPNAPNYEYKPDDIASNLEASLRSMCPNGNTPIGAHLDGLARDLNKDLDADGDGDFDDPTILPDIAADPEKVNDLPPRKIVLISDGENNGGEDPLSAATRLRTKYPNIQIDIIDMIGTGTHCYNYDEPDRIRDCDAAQGDYSGHSGKMRRVVDQSKGRYYPASNPEALLDALYSSLGTCRAEARAAEPTSDPDHC